MWTPPVLSRYHQIDIFVNSFYFIIFFGSFCSAFYERALWPTSIRQIISAIYVEIYGQNAFIQLVNFRCALLNEIHFIGTSTNWLIAMPIVIGFTIDLIGHRHKGVWTWAQISFARVASKPFIWEMRCASYATCCAALSIEKSELMRQISNIIFLFWKRSEINVKRMQFTSEGKSNILFQQASDMR